MELATALPIMSPSFCKLRRIRNGVPHRGAHLELGAVQVAIFFICDDELRIQVEFVGRMERVRKDFQTVAHRLGCKRALTNSKRSRHRHYSAYYTPELREKLAQVYAADIGLLGYSFQDEGPDVAQPVIEGRPLS